MPASPIKKLVGQTAIYGLPSMVGRLLNFLLVPLYTYYLPVENYGVLSELYAWVAFLLVFLTFGMETTFFHFLQKESDKKRIFNQSFITVFGINALFLAVILFGSSWVAEGLLFADHVEYIVLLSLIVALDALSALPLAKLRAEERAGKFAFIQSVSIAVNIVLNLLLLVFFFDPEHPEMGVTFILIANLISSGIKPAFLYKDYLNLHWRLDWQLSKSMIVYSFPLMIAGLAGIVNETIDRILLKHILYTGTDASLTFADEQVGIYSACYKLAMLVTIFLQAYRYAAEPLFFSMSKDKDRNKQYRNIMNLLIAVLACIFLVVTLNIDFFKAFIQNEAFHVGLDVVPILLLANIFLGIYLNQSIWYKLSGQTKYGAYIAIIGACVTLAVNFVFIPKYSYMAAAYATLIVYFLQMVLSYLWSRKHYPIPYNLRKFMLYTGVALVLFWLGKNIAFDSKIVTAIAKNALIVLFAIMVFFLEQNILRSSTKKQG